MVNSQPQLRIERRDYLWAAWLLGLGLIFTRQLELVTDIRMPDETTYLWRGLKLAAGELPAASDAPVYALWYLILSFFHHDTMALYYFNQRLMIAAVGPAAFLFFRSLGIRALICFGAAWFLMIATPNVVAVNKSNHMAMIMLLLGMAWGFTRESRPVQSAGLALIALIASYVRPEYYLAFVIFCVLAAADVVREHKTRGIIPFRLLAFTAVSVFILHLALGNPGASSNNRLSLAFGQHFSVNYVHWFTTDLSPWTDWERITADAFGDSTSLAQAMFANPALFFRHVFSNLAIYFRQLFFVIAHGLAPWTAFRRMAFPYLLIAVTILYYGFLGAKYSGFFPGLFSKGKILFPPRRTLLILLAAAASSCSAALAIHPNRTYILIQAPILFAVLYSILELNRFPSLASNERSLRIIHTTAIVLSLLALPRVNSYFDEPLDNAATIRHIAALNLPPPVAILEAKGGYGVYLGEGYEWVPQYIKSKPMTEFIAQHRISVIEISGELLRDSRYRDDPQWLDLVENPDKYGFVREPVPGTGNTLLIHRNP